MEIFPLRRKSMPAMRQGQLIVRITPHLPSRLWIYCFAAFLSMSCFLSARGAVRIVSGEVAQKEFVENPRAYWTGIAYYQRRLYLGTTIGLLEFDGKAVVIKKGIKCCLGVRPDDIVPVAMKRVAFQVHSLHLFVGNFPPSWIFPAIQATRHFQPFGRGRVGNQAHDGLVIPERFPSPVRRDERKESMLNLVPLAGARWKMTDGER